MLVGYANADDAGVYRIGPDLAIVQTVDFFSPIVDDPFVFGQIAAANALSDIYAMGAEPRSALSIVGFPSTELPISVLHEILRGGVEKMNEAGVSILGGHSVRDQEIKFGYAVTGLIDPRNIKQNSGALAGDELLLTKPLGTGLIGTAIKKGVAQDSHLATAIASMSSLNRTAAEIAVRESASTMTDITGFGLLGHLTEVARASNVSIEVDFGAVPVLLGALEYLAQGLIPGGLRNNRDFFSKDVSVEQKASAQAIDILFDPQTSGGLVIFCSAEARSRISQALSARGLESWRIGQVVPPANTWIRVR